VEEGPASIATFGKVVAGHKVLWRKDWDLLTIFLLDSRLYDLSEGNGVAGATSSLVSEWVCKVITVDVSEVELFREL
jgi:hypothetical protein